MAARLGAAGAQAARAAFRAGDALVLFDSTAHAVKNPTVDSIVAGERTVRGSVSAALVAAIRAARVLQRERDSVEIVVLSPFGSDELDAATGSVRRAWPGAVRLVRAPGTPNDSMPQGRPEVRSSPGMLSPRRWPCRVPRSREDGFASFRDAITPADSTWARDGGAIVAWPSSGTMAGGKPDRHSIRRLACRSGARQAALRRTVLAPPGRRPLCGTPGSRGRRRGALAGRRPGRNRVGVRQRLRALGRRHDAVSGGPGCHAGVSAVCRAVGATVRRNPKCNGGVRQHVVGGSPCVREQGFDPANCRGGRCVRRLEDRGVDAGRGAGGRGCGAARQARRECDRLNA